MSRAVRRGSGRFAYSPDVRLGLVTLQWTEHRADQPRDSLGWAATDRGWLNASIESPELTDRVCLGHYMAYPHSNSPDGNVFAVSCVSGAARYFRNLLDAREWVEAEARGREIDFAVESAALRQGLGRHEAAAVKVASLQAMGGAS